MYVPSPRGSLSENLFAMLKRPGPMPERLGRLVPDSDEDAHIALWAIHELHYRSFDDVESDVEWDPTLVALKNRLEAQFERALRLEYVSPDVSQDFTSSFSSYVENFGGASLAAFIQKKATQDQVIEWLINRSIYQLKEADPYTWVAPRLPNVTKAALMELQFDEYGAGNPAALHANLFAHGMKASGLSDRYGHYINDVSADVLADANAMSMFGLNRRMRGAALGHLAAYESTSSIPCRQVAQGLRRLGFPEPMAHYFDEHVEADAVHEQLAIRSICGSLVEEEPDLTGDVFFGAFVCLHLGAVAADRQLETWTRVAA